MMIHGSKYKYLPAVLLVLLFGLFTFYLEDHPFFSPLQKALQDQRVSTSMLDNGSLGSLLKFQNLIEVVKNDGDRFATVPPHLIKEGDVIGDDSNLIAFQRKRKPSQLLYRPADKNQFPKDSSGFLQSIKQKKDWPIISITIPERSLHDPDIGLLTNREKLGRDWERKAKVDFFDNGKIFLSTNAGLRIHGDTRRVKWPTQSYKLYFREEYGLAKVPAGVIFENTGDIYTVVVHIADWPVGEPLNNPLAYDIARRIGAPAPQTRLFEVYLNGKSLGVAYAIEHLSKRQLQQYMTDPENFTLYKYKKYNSRHDQVAIKTNVWKYLRNVNEETYSEIFSSIDKDNFTRHIFPLAFNGVTDQCQGVAIKDDADPSAKMKWIEWDLDHSFSDVYNLNGKSARKNWEQSAVAQIYRERTRCDRVLLFKGLIDNVPEYKEYAVNLYTELLNHVLTAEYLDSRVDYYDKMLTEFGDFSPYTSMLNDFFLHRPDFMRKDMAKLLTLNGPFNCSVNIQDGVALVIDGYPYNSSYEGAYFENQIVTVGFKESKEPDNFSHWTVNGVEKKEASLRLSIESDTIIKMHTRPKGSFEN